MSQLALTVWHAGEGYGERRNTSFTTIHTTYTTTYTTIRAPMHNLDDLILDQESEFLSRTPRSQAMWAEACHVMPGGVTSSWASTRPIPVWIERGQGSHVWDV